MSSLRLALACLCIATALLAASSASAAPGDLDPSFGSGGSVDLLTGTEILAKGVAVQSDSKIVVAGGEQPGNVVLIRLLSDGQLDPGFGQGGKVTTPFPGGFGEARAVAIQPDGKIVIAGGAKGMVDADVLIARYNTDGSPDSGFGGGDGIQIINVGPGEDEAEAVAIGPGGHILATGISKIGPDKTGAAVVVLKANGDPDPAFNGDGTQIVTATADESDKGVAIAELTDGRILVGDNSGNGGGDGFTLVQLLSSGLPDPGFGGGDGIVKTPIPGPDNGRLTDLLVRPGGRIVASGYGSEEVGAPPVSDDKFAAVGYLDNGELDPSFATGGLFTTQVASGAEEARSIEQTPSGQVLLAGEYDAATSNQAIALLRLNPLGALDPGFGAGGRVLRGVTAPFGDIFEESAIDPEERLVTLSTAYLGGGVTTRRVTRYLGDKVPAVPISAPVNKPAHARMKAVPKKVTAAALKGFKGTAADADGNGLQKVQVAVTKKVGKRCFAMKDAKGKFKRVKAISGRCPQRWLTVKGTAKWSFKLKRELSAGRYIVYARAVDGAGLAEAQFSRKLRNRYAFRVRG